MMAKILHALWINAPIEKVFEAVSSPHGLNQWWTLDCIGIPALGERYTFIFSPDCIWKGEVVSIQSPAEICWKMFDTQEDWENTEVGFRLMNHARGTDVEFYHTGWHESNKHFRVSSYCWAVYLRVMKAYLEKGHITPYAERDLI